MYARHDQRRGNLPTGNTHGRRGLLRWLREQRRAPILRGQSTDGLNTEKAKQCASETPLMPVHYRHRSGKRGAQPPVEGRGRLSSGRGQRGCAAPAISSPSPSCRCEKQNHARGVGWPKPKGPQSPQIAHRLLFAAASISPFTLRACSTSKADRSAVPGSGSGGCVGRSESSASTGRAACGYSDVVFDGDSGDTGYNVDLYKIFLSPLASKGLATVATATGNCLRHFAKGSGLPLKEGRPCGRQ